MAQVIIKFESDEAAQEFSDWLNNSGEQDFFNQQEANGTEDPVLEFKYKGMKGGVINVTAKVE